MRLLYVHGSRLDEESANVVQVINMCDAFRQCGVEVTLAVAAPANAIYRNTANVSALFGRELSFQIVLFDKFTIANRLVVIGSYFGARQIMAQYDTDVCFVRDPLLLNLSISAQKATIYESHNYLMHNRSRMMDKWWRHSLIRNANSKHLLKFVAISNALADFWASEGVPKSKLIALHDGFDSTVFAEQKTFNDARTRTGLPLGRKIVTYCGSLYADRGPERIIDLARNFPDALFVVLGGPESRKIELERRALESNVRNIVWKGHVPHGTVSDYLFASDVLLMMWSWNVPTIKYFSSLKLFEYMASGRIIVGQAFPTVQEVLTDGVTAHLADPSSSEDLRAKLALALAQRYPSSMAECARQMAFSLYSWKTRAERILQSV